MPYGVADTVGLSNVTNSTIFKLDPYFHARKKDWQFRAGLNIHANITNSAKVRFYPNVEASYRLFNNIFVPYAGVTGGMKRNSFNSLRLANPYILANTELLNTNQKVKLFGGVRGSVSSTVSFNLSVSQEKLEATPLYFVDTLHSFGNKYGVVYDTMSVFTMAGQIGYQKSEKLKIFGRGEFYSYSPTGQSHAWFRPDFRFTLSGVYDLADKIVVNANVFVIGARMAYSHEQIEGSTLENGNYVYEMKALVDANLGIEYRLDNRFSAFVNFNNLTTKKYQEWANFPVQSINIMGGLTYKF